MSTVTATATIQQGQQQQRQWQQQQLQQHQQPRSHNFSNNSHWSSRNESNCSNHYFNTNCSSSTNNGSNHQNLHHQCMENNHSNINACSLYPNFINSNSNVIVDTNVNADSYDSICNSPSSNNDSSITILNGNLRSAPQISTSSISFDRHVRSDFLPPPLPQPPSKSKNVQMSRFATRCSDVAAFVL
eukprot:TRINITY_DN9120_c0_g1_i1.p1 TRINITY_DN9120_c0_g1~~TRINITY_DN9120_c0_g1_i1.p1  ORF type:complete len:209 (+),score=34.17 TRINITY_DN9120_c0_g1_i1:67-627(+)